MFPSQVMDRLRGAYHIMIWRNNGVELTRSEAFTYIAALKVRCRTLQFAHGLLQGQQSLPASNIRPFC